MQSAARRDVLDWTRSIKSLRNIKNSNGPKTVPCGTPLITVMFFNLASNVLLCLCLTSHQHLR